jgi:hypothetical protein
LKIFFRIVISNHRLQLCIDALEMGDLFLLSTKFVFMTYAGEALTDIAQTLGVCRTPRIGRADAGGPLLSLANRSYLAAAELIN